MNIENPRMKMLVNLLPSLLPLLIFILADVFCDIKTALIIALVLSGVEFFYTLIKEQKADYFIVFDLIIIGLFGFFSLSYDHPLFIKLKPAIIETILCIILAISAFTPLNLVTKMSARYMPEMQLSEFQIKKMKKSLSVMFYLFTIHVVLIILSVFFCSEKIADFVSGILFYLILAVYFLFEVFATKIKNIHYKKKYKNDEWFDLLNDQGQIIGTAPRSVCHSGPGLLHPVVHLHVFDPQGRLYLQKRSENKKIQPGKWDTSVGGHVDSGENIATALSREAEEELGIVGFKVETLYQYRWDCEIESEMVFSFKTIWRGKITFEENEISEGKFWRLSEIKKNLGTGIFTPNFELEFEMLLKFLNL